MKFTKPDEKTIRRMTPRSLRALIDSLKTQRAEVVQPFDIQIKFYEDLLAKKEAEGGSDAKTTGTV